MRRYLPIALLVGAASAAPVAAQEPKWLFIETQDELSGGPEQDRRLILRAEGWTRGGATLVVACGDRVPGSERRTLLFNGGEPLHPFGGEPVAYAEVTFDRRGEHAGQYWRFFGSGPSHVAYVGEQRSPYFSEALFRKLLAAETVEVRYRTIGGERTARFDVRGFEAELRRLPGCTWPART